MGSSNLAFSSAWARAAWAIVAARLVAARLALAERRLREAERSRFSRAALRLGVSALRKASSSALTALAQLSNSACSAIRALASALVAFFGGGISISTTFYFCGSFFFHQSPKFSRAFQLYLK